MTKRYSVPKQGEAVHEIGLRQNFVQELLSSLCDPDVIDHHTMTQPLNRPTFSSITGPTCAKDDIFNSAANITGIAN